MGGEQAAKVLLQIQVASLEAKGEKISDEDKDALLAKITEKYNSTISPIYAAARLWVDAVIDPLETRKWISMGIEASNHAPVERFNVGVLQT
jgi:acetyl-CoA carboxylase carboxyltransferase component